MRYCSLLILSFLGLFVVNTANAQRFEVPKDYSFESTADYHKYDNDIIKCVNWLEKTPVSENSEKIKKAGEFMAEWISGCPYMHFSNNVRIDAFMENSPQLRVYYMGGWARYALEHPGKTDKVQCSMAGIRCALKVYKENKGMERDANVDEIAAADQQGKLQEWVTDRM